MAVRHPRTGRNSISMRYGCLAASVLLAIVPLASVAQAGADKPAVSVTVLEDTPDHVVLHYAIGAFTETTVTINGQEYMQIGLGTESQILECGAPDLPNICRSVIVGDDAALNLSVVSAESYELKDIAVAPSKGNLYRNVDPATIPYVFGPTYQVDADYPGGLATLGTPYILRDYRGVVVRVNPFQYNPVTRTLRVYTELTVEVINNGPGGVNVLQPVAGERELSLAFHQLYQHHFLNYQAPSRYTPIDEEGDLLIICYDDWMSNVQPLVDHKNTVGIDTTMVGVATIPGGNSSTAIASYIQDAYDTGDLAFVLLVGDADEVATPYASGGSADPTYALVAGDDHYPDIFVGRFSAQDAAQVDTQVSRTIDYEMMPATEQTWFKKGVGIASNQGPGDDGEYDYQHVRNIRSDLVAYGYTEVDELYDGSQGGEDDPGNPTPATVAERLNAGRGIINYCGHGSTTSWSTSGFSNSNVNALTNDNMLPFIVSVACVNGQFDGYTCFAEAWLRATNGSEPTGAIGMYASSVNQSWSPPMCAQDETVDLLCAEAYFSFGALCFAGSCQMMDEYGGSGMEMFDTWHVFGDPSVRVFGTVAPHGLQVTGEDLVANGEPGGPFIPDSTVYQLENLNDTPLDYEVTASVTWVDITSGTGTLPALGMAEVTISLNSEADALAEGLHEGTIFFTNLTDHDGDTTRPILVGVDDLAPRYAFPLNSDPGWATEGLWEFGQPTGGGSEAGDPTSGHTGDHVYGYNLSGDYTVDMPEYYLTTSAFDCSNLTYVELRFWKWLGVESSNFDHAAVEVSNGGSWTLLWANPVASMSDKFWSQMVFDISTIAAGEPTVYIRWQMGSTDGSVTYPGWNIDDIEIWGIGEPAPIEGDLDGDGDVDIADLSALLGAYGLCSGDEDFNPAADLDDSGCVDLSDLAVLLANYGTGT